jgi:hypothetical protein
MKNKLQPSNRDHDAMQSSPGTEKTRAHCLGEAWVSSSFGTDLIDEDGELTSSSDAATLLPSEDGPSITKWFEPPEDDPNSQASILIIRSDRKRETPNPPASTSPFIFHDTELTVAPQIPPPLPPPLPIRYTHMLAHSSTKS